MNIDPDKWVLLRVTKTGRKRVFLLCAPLVCLFDWNVMIYVLIVRIACGLVLSGLAKIQVSLRTYSISPNLGRLIFLLAHECALV